MEHPVVKGAAYALINTPHLLVSYGTTQMMETNKSSDYLAHLQSNLRRFEEVVSYPPNQVFIANLTPAVLADIPRPWFEKGLIASSRFGPKGEIMPENEFFGLMKIVDAFDLIMLTEEFSEDVIKILANHPVVPEIDLQKIGQGTRNELIQKVEADHEGEPLIWDNTVVGCVRRAHKYDENLSAHVIAENLATKASSYLALLHLLKQTGTDPAAIQYIIETSEEACGDMNQRGGGNFAKAIGEVCGCVNATGCDIRSFCAGPAHGIVTACALVKAGIYDQVVVVGGGAVAKLGMNGREHALKGLPILEDVLGAFAILITANDGVNPVIRTDAIGRHRIGSGSSPQAVMQAIVTDPLDRIGLKIQDIDKYSVEMQNPEITEPAGAGDVPKANYKMIGALAVKRGEMQKDHLEEFVRKHGMPGYAPTQGHIPSGVPFIGFAQDMILTNNMKRAMIIGKGSLFLARMTNQFDGVSFIMERNPGKQPPAATLSREEVKKAITDMIRKMAQTLIKENEGI